MDGSENFLRTWDEYKSGFGNKSGEFWFGRLFFYIYCNTTYTITTMLTGNIIEPVKTN